MADADGHILAPLDLWDRYIDPEFRERRPRFVIDGNGKERLSVEGKPPIYPHSDGFFPGAPRMLSERLGPLSPEAKHQGARRRRPRPLRPELTPAFRDHARSKRSRFITLVQAATKSPTNFVWASELP